MLVPSALSIFNICFTLHIEQNKLLVAELWIHFCFTTCFRPKCIWIIGKRLYDISGLNAPCQELVLVMSHVNEKWFDCLIVYCRELAKFMLLKHLAVLDT